MQREFAAVALNAHLGFELADCTPEGATVRMRAEPRFLQEGGVVHGGILATLADTAAVAALLRALPAGQLMTSIEFKLNFLSAARAGDTPLVARSQVVRRGRRVGVCRVDVEQGGRALATGLFTYLFTAAET